MSVAGIIAEFDPFHNGHQYLIDTVRRELSPRAVVCVMSGQFTQRGEPAILDKFTRANLAVQGGADLVVELPVCCAVNAAREFAFGGVRTLHLLGFVTHLAFGSETGDVKLLERAAELALKENDAFRKALCFEGELTFKRERARFRLSVYRNGKGIRFPEFMTEQRSLCAGDIQITETELCHGIVHGKRKSAV